jgi:hypothetical protein
MSLTPLWLRLTRLEAQTAGLACPTLMRQELPAILAQACEAAGIAAATTHAMCDALERQLATISMPPGLIPKAREAPILKAMTAALVAVAEAHQMDTAYIVDALEAAMRRAQED